MLLRLLREIARKFLQSQPSTRLEQIHAAMKTGNLREARALCEAALKSRPDDLELLHLAGAVACHEGDEARATTLLRRAAESALDPEPAYALGHLLQNAGQREEAIGYFERAVSIDGNRYDYRFTLAKALARAGRPAAAERHLRTALTLRPDAYEPLVLLARVLYDQGRNEELAQTVRAMQRMAPFDGGNIFVALLVPVIYHSRQEIEQVRRDLTQRIDELLEGPPLAVADPVREIGITPFYIAYHGMNDCELQQRIVRLCRKAYVPGFSAPLAPRRRNGRIRIGFVSEHFGFHSVGRVNHGLISGLRRDEFEVTVFALARHDDWLARKIRADSDRYVDFGDATLADVERGIAEHAMDVLLFTDVGMDPLTYFLAYSRLAPLQCVAWGHPDTTGIDTLDCAISADALELPDAEAHYTERLVRLPAWVMPGYIRPTPPRPLKRRAAYGLDDRAHLYVCPQAPMKLHPDFDGAIGGILRGDPRGEVVLVEGRHPRYTELLKQRFQRGIPDVADRVRVLPRLSWEDYLNVIAVSDVMLDTFHFGGANTTYEGLAMGVPVVTLPSAYLRGRHSLGCYLKMGFSDCVATTPEQYVEIAVRLGTEPDYHRDIGKQISEASGALFDNYEMTQALGDFLLEACGGLR